MSILYGLTVAAAVLMPLAATAQQPQQSHQQLDPADAMAAVPRLVYRSAFAQYQPFANDDAASPDAVWKQANQTLREKSPPASHAMPMDHAHQHGGHE